MQYVDEQLTQPAVEPITLALVKKHLAIDHDDDDDAITNEIKAARQDCEEHTGRLFGSRTRRLSMSEWPCDGIIRFPVEPVTAVTAMRYKDTDEVAQTVNASNWRTWLPHSPPILKLVSTFTRPYIGLEVMGGIEVDYTAGEVAIPEGVCIAIKLIVAYWRDNPGGEQSLGHLSRGIPAGAIRQLNLLWTGAM